MPVLHAASSTGRKKVWVIKDVVLSSTQMYGGSAQDCRAVVRPHDDVLRRRVQESMGYIHTADESPLRCKGHEERFDGKHLEIMQHNREGSLMADAAENRTCANLEEFSQLPEELVLHHTDLHSTAPLHRRRPSAADDLLVVALLLSWLHISSAQTQCNTDCTCTAFGEYMGECTAPTPECGFLPCIGGPSCPSGPPKSLSAFVTGPGTIALQWTDPESIALLDQYNIYYTMSEGASPCAGKSTGSVCSFRPPPGSTQIAGVCGPNNEGVQFCWIAFSVYILAIPPCGLDDTSCNFQEVNSGIVIGKTYQYKIDAGRCCYGDPQILNTPGCRACTDFDAFQTCPKSSTFAFAKVTGQAFPSAVLNMSVTVDGDRALRVRWLVPADTGTRSQVPTDILAYVVTRSTKADFSTDIVTSTLTGTTLTIRDTGLLPNVHYYYRVQSKNVACANLAACGGTSVANLTAVGIPSAPTGLNLTYIVGQENTIRAVWALPSDTGLGDGSPNRQQPLVCYRLHINNIFYALVGSELNFTFIATGLNSGTQYTFAVTATNIAGEGPVISASKIACGQPQQVTTFTAAVNPTDGPRKIRLTWSPPSNTGQGNQVQPITGYRIEMDSSTAFLGTPTFVTITTPFEQACTITASNIHGEPETSQCTITTTVSFAAARKAHYFFRIYARNFITYSNSFAIASEQSVALPSSPLSVSAVVTKELTIDLAWTIPTDTGVGDTSRPLLKYRVLRSWGKSDMTCTLNCSDCSGCSYSQIGACCLADVSSYDNQQRVPYDVLSLPQSETRFYFRVFGVNAVGDGAVSSIVNEQGVKINMVDSKPTSVTTSIPFVLALTVTWQPPLDTGVGRSSGVGSYQLCSVDCRPITAYRLKIKTTSGETIYNDLKNVSSRTHTISGLLHNIEYTFEIYSLNSAGESTYFEMVKAFPVNYPAAPTSFVALVSNSSHKVDLSWDTPGDTGRTQPYEPILSYLLEVDTFNSSFVAGNVLLLCDGLTTVCTGLSCTCAFKTGSVTFLAKRFEHYYFRVKARNQVGFGGYASTSQQSVGTPSQVINTSAAVIGTRQIKLDWKRPTDSGVGVGYLRTMTRYVVQRSYGDVNFAGCGYGTKVNDNCDFCVPPVGNCVPPVGNCCSKDVPEATLTMTDIVPSVGPTYFYYRVLGQNEVGFGSQPQPAREQGVNPPKPVRSMEVNSIGPGAFRVTWTQVIDSGLGINNTDRIILKFMLQICQDPVRDFTGDLYFEKDFPRTTFEFEKYDFIGGRNYTFRIIAFNDAGQGDASVGITVPAISLPSEPLNFRAEVTVPLQINLHWVFPRDTGFGDPATVPLRAYVLNISTSPDFTQFEELTLDPALLAWNHTNLIKGTIYYYRIRSKTDAGLSKTAPNTTDMAISAPGTPRNFSVNIYAPLEINASWVIPEDTGMGAQSSTPRPLIRYELLVASSDASIELSDDNLATASFTTIIIGPSATTYILLSLQKGFRYYLKMMAVNSAGKSIATGYLRDRGISKPLAVTNVTAVVTKPFEISVSWRPNDDSGLGPGLLPDQLLASGGMRIDISPNFSDFRNSTQLLLSGTVSSYSFTGLTKAVNYFFRIFSRNRAGWSVSSVVVTDRAIDIPSLPRFFTVQTSIYVELQLNLMWLLSSDTGAGDQSNPINTYRLQESIGEEPNISTPNITIAGTALLEYRGNRTKGVNYFYRLYARNNAGESASTPVVNEMAIERPTVPLNFTVDWMGPMRLFLNWTRPIDTGNGPYHLLPRQLVAFDMDIDTSSAFNSVRTITLAGSAINHTISHPDLVQGTLYHFRLRTNNTAGYSPFSNSVSKTAINLSTAPRNLVAEVTSPLEITLTWDTPSNTGGIGQTWNLLNYTLYMATNETHLGERLILMANVNAHVQVALTKAVRYYFRVYAINEAGTGPTSNSATEEGVTLPTMVTLFKVSNPRDLELLLTWQLPFDTGTGGHNRSLLRYILEKDDVLTSNGSFFASPFSLDLNSTCFMKASPPCNPAQSNQMSIDQVFLRTERLFTNLQWGNTFFFRIFAVNSAGRGVSTPIINEQALVLPSAPVDLNNNLKTLNGKPVFELTWKVPAETGAGNIPRFQDPTGAVRGQARTIDNYVSQAAPVPPGVSALNANFDDPANTVATNPSVTSTKTDILIGFVYYFRVAAINPVGFGPWSQVTTSGPEIKQFLPHSGPAAGAFPITVYGLRFGTSTQNIDMKIGGTSCPTIKMIEDDVAFICVAPPGTGGTKDVIVRIAAIPVVRQRQFVYDAPVISGVVPELISSQQNQIITIVGKNFGVIDMTPAAFISGAVITPCSSNMWIADTSIQCFTPEIQEGAVERNTVQVVVDGVRNSILSDDAPYFNYTDLPTFYSQCLRQPTEVGCCNSN